MKPDGAGAASPGVPRLELVEFRHSPYNEKVRWALDLKGVDYARRSVLPGPHLLQVRRLTGRTTTPVLVIDGRALDGSARIVEWLDAHRPAPPLLPAGAAAREAALAIQRRFDDDLTPRIRRAVLDALLRAPAMFAAVFGEDRGPAARRAYAALLPLAAGAIRRANGIAGPASVADGLRALDEALELVAAAGDGPLAGGAFGVADLAAASALATVVGPADSPMALPEPVAGPFRTLVEHAAAHPGAAWVRRTYRTHRPPSRGAVAAR